MTRRMTEPHHKSMDDARRSWVARMAAIDGREATEDELSMVGQVCFEAGFEAGMKYAASKAKTLTAEQYHHQLSQETKWFRDDIYDLRSGKAPPDREAKEQAKCPHCRHEFDPSGMEEATVGSMLPGSTGLPHTNCPNCGKCVGCNILS